MLAQLALLMIFQFIGQAVVTGLGIMFPGPLCGIITSSRLLIRQRWANKRAVRRGVQP